MKKKNTAVDGIPELKAAVSRKFKRENKLDYKPSPIIIGAGGKHIFYNVMVATFIAFFFSSRRRHTRWPRDWSSDVCSSDLSGSSGTNGDGVAAKVTGR